MKIISFRRGEVGWGVLAKCAELYCQIWREHPWNEDFWTVAKVLDDMEKEFSKTFSEAFVAVNGNREVLGFTWGYAVTRSELTEICGTREMDGIFLPDDERVFYVDELGVSSLCRDRGIGTHLTQSLIGAIKSRGVISKILLRTDEKAENARKLYQKLGFHELAARDAAYSDRTYWLLALEKTAAGWCACR